MEKQQAETADAGMTKQVRAGHSCTILKVRAGKFMQGHPSSGAARPHTSTLCRKRPFSASFSEIVALAAARVVSASLMLASSLDTCECCRHVSGHQTPPEAGSQQ